VPTTLAAMINGSMTTARIRGRPSDNNDSCFHKKIKSSDHLSSQSTDAGDILAQNDKYFSSNLGIVDGCLLNAFDSSLDAGFARRVARQVY
jgi:hypothetical protein